MNLKRSFGIICVACIGVSTPLVAQLPEVESLSKVPAWVGADDHPNSYANTNGNPNANMDNAEQRFEPSYQSDNNLQDYNSSAGYSDTYSSPEARLQLGNTLEFESNAGVTPIHSNSNLNGASDFNYGAFTSSAPDVSDNADSFDSYQSAETGRGRLSSQDPGYSEQQSLDPSNPMLSVFKKMDTLMQEVQELRGKLEEQNFAIQNLQQSQKALYSDVDKHVNEVDPAKIGALLAPILTQEQPNAIPSAISAFDFSDAQAVVPQAEQHQEQEMYQQAYQFIQSKDYDSALMGFKSLVKTYPRGQHAPNANYWMGEIYLVQGELDLAAHAFDEVYQEFPQHPKASDALLKLGYVEYAKGQWIRSRNLLTQVKSQFPSSTSARLADTRLQRMHQEGRI